MNVIYKYDMKMSMSQNSYTQSMNMIWWHTKYEEFCDITNRIEWIIESWQISNENTFSIDHNRLAKIVIEYARQKWKVWEEGTLKSTGSNTEEVSSMNIRTRSLIKVRRRRSHNDSISDFYNLTLVKCLGHTGKT